MNNCIHYFYISHNAPCSPQKFCIGIVFNFSWEGCNTQGKQKTKVYATFGGTNKVHYGKCGSGVYKTVYVVNSSLELVPVGLLAYAYVTLSNGTSISPSEKSAL